MQNEKKANKKVAVFASRSGSNAEAIIKAFQAANLPVDFYGVSNRTRGTTPFYDKMAALNVQACRVSSPKYGTEPILNFLHGPIKFDLIVMAGYMCKMPAEVVREFTVLNIHPSILPLYKGREDAYVDVINNGETITGCTVQRANEQLDTGPLIAQIGFEIPARITETKDLDMLRRIGLAHEHALYPAVVYNILFERGKNLNMREVGEQAVANMWERDLPLAETIIPKKGKRLFDVMTSAYYDRTFYDYVVNEKRTRQKSA